MKTKLTTPTYLFTLMLGLLATVPARAQSKPAAADASAQAIKQAVLETNEKMTRAANQLDVDTFFSHILDSSQCVIIQNGTVFKSRQEAMEAVKRGFAGMTRIDRRFNDPQVTVLSPDAALLTAEGSVSATLTDGRVMDGGHFAVSLVFVRRDGQWKLLHGHYSMPARM